MKEKVALGVGGGTDVAVAVGVGEAGSTLEPPPPPLQPTTATIMAAPTTARHALRFAFHPRGMMRRVSPQGSEKSRMRSPCVSGQQPAVLIETTRSSRVH
ncbi:hypothetical protein HRbin30_02733 [bacterium HR30]|nr:hypothetical protein HRbin30_02733 [bacterium HR30]